MKKPFYKRWWFIALVVIVIIGALGSNSEESTKEENETNSAIAQASSDGSPDNTSKEDKEAEAKANAEAKKKEEENAAAQLEAEKNFYLNEVKSKIDTQMKMYDDAWAEIWVPTFEGLGTSIDIYTAYDNMKVLKQRYDTLYQSFPAIKGEELSKENKKTLKEFTNGMRDAAMWRKSAADKAMKMFDKGDFSPSSMEKLKTDIGYADNQMMTAIVSLTMLEMSLGVERSE